MNDLNAKAKQAAESFLSRRGYDILDDGWEDPSGIVDIVACGADVVNGSFGENIIVEGFDLKSLPIGTRFRSGDVVLELTQIGKECHAHCAIYHKMGDCIMPREGVFCKVIEGGRISSGDSIDVIAS